MPTAVVTGASRGFGRALAAGLAERGWTLVLDARGHADLHRAAKRLPADRTVAIAGDVTDPDHRASLVTAARRLGGPHLLVNNASHLGPSPQPRLGDYPPAELARVFAVDVLAPHDLVRQALPGLRAARGTVVNISSDAAVEAYERWGAYGASKAALEQLGRVWAAELAGTGVRVVNVDPGEMDTRMHADAIPDANRAELADPARVANEIVALLQAEPGPAPGARVAIRTGPSGTEASP